MVRVLVIGFLFGNAFSIAFSLSGGILSLLCMEAARRYLKLSGTGVSMVGGVTHNLGQIVIAVFVVENVRVAYYFSILAVSGLVTGILIGILSSELLRRVKKGSTGAERRRKNDRIYQRNLGRNRGTVYYCGKSGDRLSDLSFRAHPLAEVFRWEKK